MGTQSNCLADIKKVGSCKQFIHQNYGSKTQYNDHKSINYFDSGEAHSHTHYVT